MFYDNINQGKKRARQKRREGDHLVKVCRELTDTEENKAEGAQMEARGSTYEWLTVFFERFLFTFMAGSC